MTQHVAQNWLGLDERAISHDIHVAKYEAGAPLGKALDLLDQSKLLTKGDLQEVQNIRDKLKDLETEFEQRVLFGKGPLNKVEAKDFLARIHYIREEIRQFRIKVQERYSAWLHNPSVPSPPPLNPPLPPNVAQRFGPGGIIGGIGGNGISIGGTGHGFGGGAAGGGSVGGSRHGFGGGGGSHIPGMGDLDDIGDLVGGLPGGSGVHGGGYQGNYGNGFFGTGFLNGGIGLGHGLPGGARTPSSGGGLTGKHSTGGGTTGGSYVDSTSRNDARGSGSDRERGGEKPSGDKPTGGTPDKDGDAGARDETAHEKSLREEKEIEHEMIEHYYEQHKNDGTGTPAQSQPVDGGGGDTGGNASESRRTFTGFHPQSSGPAGGVSIGGGAHHLP